MDLIDFEDDEIEELAALELIEFGIPRKIYERSNYFDSMDELSFFRRFRLQKHFVLRLLTEIEHLLEFPYDINRSVSPMNQILITLRYYATGNHLMSIGDFTGVHTSTVCRIICRVSEAIASFYRNYISFPQTAEEIQREQELFFEIAAFPRIIGAIDCTHVKIQSPGGNDAEVYRNRKSYFSLNVQAVCLSNLKLINVVARWPGSAHDATIFNNSNLRAEFELNRYPNCIILGDSGYNLRPYLLTPLLEPRTNNEQLYNQAHIRTRNVIERCFGVWKRRFPVLAYGCRLKIETLQAIIVATAILHNIAIDMGEHDLPPDEIDGNILDQLILDGQIPPIPLIDQRCAGEPDVNIRNEFIQNYFGRL